MNGLNVVAVQIQLENAGALDWFAIDLALCLGTAIEEHPGGLDRIGMAHAEGRLTGMIAGEPQHDASDATTELFDGFIAGQRAAPDFMQEPLWPAEGNLPVGNTLQVAADVGFA